MDVVSDSPADMAGLRPNDVITEVGGQPINTADELGKAIRDHEAGDTVTISFWRGDRLEHTQATLFQRPSAQ